MKLCTIDEEGRPTGFYESEIHRQIPEHAFEISAEQWRECLENQGRRRFEDGRLVECELET